MVPPFPIKAPYSTLYSPRGLASVIQDRTKEPSPPALPCENLPEHGSFCVVNHRANLYSRFGPSELTSHEVEHQWRASNLPSVSVWNCHCAVRRWTFSGVICVRGLCR